MTETVAQSQIAADSKREFGYQGTDAPMLALEEDRTPVGRTDFKSDETRSTCLVGSTPTLFRHFDLNHHA